MEVKQYHRVLSALLDHRLVVLIGKGGVGKTTLSAALGLLAARNGRRVLLAEIRSPRRLPALFGREADQDGPVELQPGIHWINLTPQAALQTYAVQLLRFRSVYRAVFEQQAVRRFLRAVPSLAEILVLGHLAHLLEQSQFDLAILDAPSTGPGMLLLEAPRAILNAAPRGPLLEGATWIQRLLSDSKRAAVQLVVVPEELPVSEAIELSQRFRGELALPLSLVLVNRVLRDPFPPGSEQLLAKAATLDTGRALHTASELYRTRLQWQERSLERLQASVDLPAAFFPEVIDPPSGAALVAALAEAIDGDAGGTR